MTSKQYMGYFAGAVLTNIVFQSAYTIMYPRHRRNDTERYLISGFSSIWPISIPALLLFSGLMVPQMIITSLDHETVKDYKKFGGGDSTYN